MLQLYYIDLSLHTRRVRRLQLTSVANITSYAGEPILLRTLTYMFEPSFKEQRFAVSRERSGDVNPPTDSAEQADQY